MRRPVPLAAAAALLLAACAGDEPPAEPDATGTPGALFPVTVGDVTLEEQPTRIVSLSPAVTEMLFAIGAGEQVVAVDELSNYPPEAPVTDLSGFTVNPEAVATYEPDLVVISAFADEVVPQLGALDIPVHVAADNPLTIEDVYGQITDLGTLTGHPDEAADVVERMGQDLAKLAADAPDREEPLTYYFEIDDNYWSYTSASIVGSLLSTVGMENIAQEESVVSVQLTAEAIVDANPDVILLADTAYGVDAATVAERPGWSEIAAVREGQIVELDSDIASRWGPRLVDLVAAVVDAVSQVP